MPSDNVELRLVNEYATDRSIHGDGKTILEWDLSGTPEDIVKVCASAIRQKLIWLSLDSDVRIKKSLAYFEDLGRPRIPALHSLLEDSDVRIAFENFDETPQRGVEWASLWVCSPKKRKLLYISIKG